MPGKSLGSLKNIKRLKRVCNSLAMSNNEHLRGVNRNYQVVAEEGF